MRVTFRFHRIWLALSLSSCYFLFISSMIFTFSFQNMVSSISTEQSIWRKEEKSYTNCEYASGAFFPYFYLFVFFCVLVKSVACCYSLASLLYFFFVIVSDFKWWILATSSMLVGVQAHNQLNARRNAQTFPIHIYIHSIISNYISPVQNFLSHFPSFYAPQVLFYIYSGFFLPFRRYKKR